jgi:hypothetical protein
MFWCVFRILPQVLECVSEAERNSLYSAIVCLIAQTNKLFNPEALQIIQVSSASYRRRKAAALGGPGATRSPQQDAEILGTSKATKKMTHTNKLNHSTMKTLEAMGHFSTDAGNMDQLLGGEEGGEMGSRERTHTESDDGRKSDRKSDLCSEDSFSAKPLPTFPNGRTSLKKDASVSQDMDYGKIYRGSSKEEIDIAASSNSPAEAAGARPSILMMGSSTYSLTANPLAQPPTGEEGMTRETSTNSTKAPTPSRRTSLTMAGIGKTQTPINIKSRRKSVIK